MWIVEVNFAGYRFTHRVPDRPRAWSLFRFSPRTRTVRASQMPRTTPA